MHPQGRARCESVHGSEGSCADILGMSLRNNFSNLPHKHVLSVYEVSVLGCWDTTASKTHACKGAGREKEGLVIFTTEFGCVRMCVSVRMQVNVCFL